MLTFLRLAMMRKRSPEHYRAMQAFIAHKTVDELMARGVDISTRHVLELAAGAGGYSAILSQRSKSFVATDLHPNPYYEQQGIPFMQFDATRPFPLDTGSVDLI